ncbi:MAG: TlpA disulfide reductase family protein [Acidobacteriota bacterium]
MSQVLDEWRLHVEQEDDYATAAERAQAFGDRAWSKLDSRSLSLDDYSRLLSARVHPGAELEHVLRVELEKRSAAQGEEGGLAALLRLHLMEHASPAESFEVVDVALSHPALPQLLQDGAAWQHFSGLLRADQQILLYSNRQRIADLAGHLPERLPPQSLVVLQPLLLGLATVDPSHPELYSSFKERLSAAFRAEIADPDDSLGVEELERLRLGLSLLESVDSRRVIGSQAPELELAWVTKEGAPASLADLRGRLVVLEFWATWCGNCVAKFDELRRLRSELDEDEIVLIGATWLQGQFFLDGKLLDLVGTPELEIEQLQVYAEKEEMTWPIALTDQFQAVKELGIKGLPHVTVVDRLGRIRGNGSDLGVTELRELIKSLQAEGS